MDTKISHFKNWLSDWDAAINSYDDRMRFRQVIDRINNCAGIIHKIGATREKKITADNGDKAGEMLCKYHDSQPYKDLRYVEASLVVLTSEIENMQEMNRRKTHEIFTMRAEIERLRNELHKVTGRQ